MSSQHEASAVNSASAPSHHSGPGYVTNRDTSDFELNDQLREAATRWLNLVPAEHRHDSPQPPKGFWSRWRSTPAAAVSTHSGLYSWPIATCKIRRPQCGWLRSSLPPRRFGGWGISRMPRSPRKRQSTPIQSLTRHAGGPPSHCTGWADSTASCSNSTSSFSRPSGSPPGGRCVARPRYGWHRAILPQGGPISRPPRRWNPTSGSCRSGWGTPLSAQRSMQRLRDLTPKREAHPVTLM